MKNTHSYTWLFQEEKSFQENRIIFETQPSLHSHLDAVTDTNDGEKIPEYLGKSDSRNIGQEHIATAIHEIEEKLSNMYGRGLLNKSDKEYYLGRANSGLIIIADEYTEKLNQSWVTHTGEIDSLKNAVLQDIDRYIREIETEAAQDFRNKAAYNKRVRDMREKFEAARGIIVPSKNSSGNFTEPYPRSASSQELELTYKTLKNENRKTTYHDLMDQVQKIENYEPNVKQIVKAISDPKKAKEIETILLSNQKKYTGQMAHLIIEEENEGMGEKISEFFNNKKELEVFAGDPSAVIQAFLLKKAEYLLAVDYKLVREEGSQPETKNPTEKESRTKNIDFENIYAQLVHLKIANSSAEAKEILQNGNVNIAGQQLSFHEKDPQTITQELERLLQINAETAAKYVSEHYVDENERESNQNTIQKLGKILSGKYNFFEKDKKVIISQFGKGEEIKEDTLIDDLKTNYDISLKEDGKIDFTTLSEENLQKITDDSEKMDKIHTLLEGASGSGETLWKKIIAILIEIFSGKDLFNAIEESEIKMILDEFEDIEKPENGWNTGDTINIDYKNKDSDILKEFKVSKNKKIQKKILARHLGIPAKEISAIEFKDEKVIVTIGSSNAAESKKSGEVQVSESNLENAKSYMNQKDVETFLKTDAGAKKLLTELESYGGKSLITAIIAQESGGLGNPQDMQTAQSPVHALGGTQVMPETAINLITQYNREYQETFTECGLDETSIKNINIKNIKEKLNNNPKLSVFLSMLHLKRSLARWENINGGGEISKTITNKNKEEEHLKWNTVVEGKKLSPEQFRLIITSEYNGTPFIIRRIWNDVAQGDPDRFPKTAHELASAIRKIKQRDPTTTLEQKDLDQNADYLEKVSAYYQVLRGKTTIAALKKTTKKPQETAQTQENRTPQQKLQQYLDTLHEDNDIYKRIQGYKTAYNDKEYIAFKSQLLEFLQNDINGEETKILDAQEIDIPKKLEKVRKLSDLSQAVKKEGMNIHFLFWQGAKAIKLINDFQKECSDTPIKFQSIEKYIPEETNASTYFDLLVSEQSINKTTQQPNERFESIFQRYTQILSQKKGKEGSENADFQKIILQKLNAHIEQYRSETMSSSLSPTKKLQRMKNVYKKIQASKLKIPFDFWERQETTEMIQKYFHDAIEKRESYWFFQRRKANEEFKKSISLLKDSIPEDLPIYNVFLFFQNSSDKQK